MFSINENLANLIVYPRNMKLLDSALKILIHSHSKLL